MGAPETPAAQPRDRYQRARNAATKLTEAHNLVEEANYTGELDDVLDHLARVIRLAHETARDAALESRR